MAQPFDQRPIPIDLLRTIFTSEHVPALFAGRETHDPALRFVAQLVQHTDDVDRIRDIIAAALPEGYERDTLDEVPEMVRGAKAKGFGDSERRKTKTEGNKPSPVDLIRANNVDLFHDAQDRAFMGAPLRGGGIRNLLIGSSTSSAWVLYRTQGRTITTQRTKDILGTLLSLALFDGPLDGVRPSGWTG